MSCGSAGGVGGGANGGGSDGGASTVIEPIRGGSWSEVTSTPSASEAAAAVPTLERSAAATAAAVVEVGTAMVAVMRTLAAVTLIVTSDLSTPAASATRCCKLDLTLSV